MIMERRVGLLAEDGRIASGLITIRRLGVGRATVRHVAVDVKPAVLHPASDGLSSDVSVLVPKRVFILLPVVLQQKGFRLALSFAIYLRLASYLSIRPKPLSEMTE